MQLTLNPRCAGVSEFLGAQKGGCGLSGSLVAQAAVLILRVYKGTSHRDI